jgi:2-methylcitrate dehydratase PrpD
LTKDLGRRFYADCVIKPYSACRATHLSIDCALQIARRNDIKVGEIKEIMIHTAPATIAGFVGQPFTPGETPQVDGAFSIRYTVATALLKKDVKPEYFSDDCIRDPKTNMLIDKIVLSGSMTPEKASTTDIQVIMKNGKTYSAQTDFPKGDFRKTPLTGDEVRAKYRSNVAFSQTVAPRNAEKALGIIERLEELKDVRELTKLLVKE